MIEHIFVSKVRIKILKLFFTDLKKEIHIRGIVRKIEEEINAVRRELKNLEKAEILKREARGNRHYYSINKKSPLFDQILGLINKEFGLGGEIIKNMDIIGETSFAILTRSYIYNTYESDNDVDLMLVGKIKMNETAKIIKNCESFLGREVRYTILSDEDFQFRKKKRDSFTLNIIHRRHILLIGDEDILLA